MTYVVTNLLSDIIIIPGAAIMWQLVNLWEQHIISCYQWRRGFENTFQLKLHLWFLVWAETSSPPVLDMISRQSETAASFFLLPSSEEIKLLKHLRVGPQMAATDYCWSVLIMVGSWAILLVNPQFVFIMFSVMFFFFFHRNWKCLRMNTNASWK